MATLVFDIDDDQRIEVPLKGTMTLGSGEGNDILVEADEIAAEHARLVPGPTGCLLEDLGTGRSRVNGKAVIWHVLQDGDKVEFGVLSGQFVDPDGVKDVKPSPKQRAVLQKHKEELAGLQSAISTATAELAKLKADHGTVTAALVKEEELLERELRDLGEQIRGGKAAVEKTDAERKAGAKAVADLSAKKNKLQAESDRLRQENEAARVRAAGELAQLTEENGPLSRRVNRR